MNQLTIGLFAQRGVQFVVCFFAALTTFAYAQPTPVPLTGVSFSPPNPDVYEPFKVTVTFSKPYCIADSPYFSAVTLTGNQLSVSLSHFGNGPCATQRTFNLSGLPDGAFDVNVAVTGTYLNSTSNVRETTAVERGTFPLTVGGSVQYGKTKVYTTLQNGALVLDRRPQFVQPAPSVPYDANTLTGYDEAEFTVYPGLGLGRIGVPNSAVPVWQLLYPTPLKGSFATTDEAEKNRLSAVGFSFLGGGSTLFFVLPLVNGACPLGATPIYRLFNPKAPAHRYVSSLDTYNTLAANGFIGEGMVFCAPRP